MSNHAFIASHDGTITQMNPRPGIVLHALAQHPEGGTLQTFREQLDAAYRLGTEEQRARTAVLSNEHALSNAAQVISLREQATRCTQQVADAEHERDQAAEFVDSQAKIISSLRDEIEDLQHRNDNQARWLAYDEETYDNGLYVFMDNLKLDLNNARCAHASTKELLRRTEEDLGNAIKNYDELLTDRNSKTKELHEVSVDRDAAVNTYKSLSDTNTSLRGEIRRLTLALSNADTNLNEYADELSKLGFHALAIGNDLSDADEALTIANDAITIHWHDARDAQAEVYRLMGELASSEQRRLSAERLARYWADNTPRP